MRALIVDDEPVARKILREELEALSVEIAGEAENGESALLQILSGKPDVVFLDIQMPAMSGFELLTHLHGDHAPAIVMVTAYDQHAIQAFEAGAIAGTRAGDPTRPAGGSQNRGQNRPGVFLVKRPRGLCLSSRGRSDLDHHGQTTLFSHPKSQSH